jgi:hypothetical protein
MKRVMFLLTLLLFARVCFGQKDTVIYGNSHDDGGYFKGAHIKGTYTPSPVTGAIIEFDSLGNKVKDSVTTGNNQDRYLRIHAFLVDSLKFSCHCYDSVKGTIYKFKIEYLDFGHYPGKFIYICNYESLNSINFKNGNEIFWSVTQTDELFYNIPIYLHSGNF